MRIDLVITTDGSSGAIQELTGAWHVQRTFNFYSGPLPRKGETINFYEKGDSSLRPILCEVRDVIYDIGDGGFESVWICAVVTEIYKTDLGANH